MTAPADPTPAQAAEVTPGGVVARLRRLLAAATPGPWAEGFTGRVVTEGSRPVLGRAVTVVFDTQAHQGDLALIAAAVNALPALLDAVEAAAAYRAAEREHEAALKRYHDPDNTPGQDHAAWADVLRLSAAHDRAGTKLDAALAAVAKGGA